ncbi:adenosylcobinamide hydrolase [Methanomicrobium sp. W14]|uniref:adenosylcobinamide amidohydrolase n=1 Tax=Methanomicrobium sp. W14 TaxID=2817839 RepID=UPI001AE939A9|nr:adenosylcobinamide amidohydrolase [Methanomicrobium sp. W14]MBP2133425.1 adenosylcobinamide hydrolase [Methanomicrobium sp. W14]
MKYFLHKNTLFIRGSFKAASTGINGGISDITTVVNHTVPRDFNEDDPYRLLRNIISERGYKDDFFGMLTAVGMKNLCIMSYEYITVFVTAGVSNPNPKGPNTINIIIHSREALSDGALLETIITATEAKADALISAGYSFTGTTTDEVVVIYDRQGSENRKFHESAGTYTGCGDKVYTCVKNGVTESIRRYDGVIEADEPSFFIFTTKDGLKMNLWQRRKCQYYPCHFKGQRCELCYCPHYPCGDEELGEWVDSVSQGKKIWSCKNCLLNHYPDIVRAVLKNPETELSELKKISCELGLKMSEQQPDSNTL